MQENDVEVDEFPVLFYHLNMKYSYSKWHVLFRDKKEDFFSFLIKVANCMSKV